MTTKVTYLGNLRTESIHVKSNTTVLSDAPVDNNGKGETFSPTDLMSNALAQCVITIMGIKSNEKGWNIDGSKAEVTKIMGSNPRCVSEIKITFLMKGDLDEKSKTILENAGKACPVSKSLHPDLIQNLEFIWE
ncbi:MAG: OsmC family protein [Flavobacteriales bacterium]